MGFSNPATPVDYGLVEQAVEAGIDYTAIRNACELALVSTDAALSALATTVANLHNLSSAQAQSAAEAALVSTDAAISALDAAIGSVSAILSEVPRRPDVPGWSSARENALSALVAVQHGLDAANAELTRNPDASPEAAAVISDLEAQAAALWPDVK